MKTVSEENGKESEGNGRIYDDKRKRDQELEGKNDGAEGKCHTEKTMTD